MPPYLEVLREFRNDLTVISGTSHPEVNDGHASEHSFLTGAPHPSRAGFRNSISIDQMIARHAGAHTRIPSLVLSSQGGVGTKSRSTTISFDPQGRAIPAESTPRRIFERLFEPPADGDRTAREPHRQRRDHPTRGVREVTADPITRRHASSAAGTLKRVPVSLKNAWLASLNVSSS